MIALAFSESIVEQAALAWFSTLGYTTLDGLSIAPDSPTPSVGTTPR